MPRLQTPRPLTDPATPKATPPLSVVGVNITRRDEHRRVRRWTEYVEEDGGKVTPVPREQHEVTLEAGATFLVRGGPDGRDVMAVNWEDFDEDERLLIGQALKAIEKKAYERR